MEVKKIDVFLFFGVYALNTQMFTRGLTKFAATHSNAIKLANRPAGCQQLCLVQDDFQVRMCGGPGNLLGGVKPIKGFDFSYDFSGTVLCFREPLAPIFYGQVKVEEVLIQVTPAQIIYPSVPVQVPEQVQIAEQVIPAPIPQVSESIVSVSESPVQIPVAVIQSYRQIVTIRKRQLWRWIQRRLQVLGFFDAQLQCCFESLSKARQRKRLHLPKCQTCNTRFPNYRNQYSGLSWKLPHLMFRQKNVEKASYEGYCSRYGINITNIFQCELKMRRHAFDQENIHYYIPIDKIPSLEEYALDPQPGRYLEHYREQYLDIDLDFDQENVI